jgi:glycolate oxidase
MIKDSVVAELAKIVGRRNLHTAGESLSAYSYDGTTNWVAMPEAVIFPSTVQEVAAIVKIANAEKIPVTPRGAGTCLSGGPVPVKGGIVLCTTNMSKILKVDTDNGTAIVEPGVVLADLNIILARDGFFLPPDPQSFISATIAGMIAENSGGPTCLKYGVTRQYVLGLEVVLPSGDIVHLGKKYYGTAGYSLAEIFIGSEGTLGIVTQAQLKVIPLPKASRTILGIYDDVALAGENVYRVLENGIIPGKIEFIDNWVINKFEDVMQIGLPRSADAVLFFEVDGDPDVVEKEALKIREIAEKYGAREVRLAKDADDANKYWMGRRAGLAAVFDAARTVLLKDVTVPRGNIPDLIRKIREVSKKYDLQIVTIGHAGDGNLHPSIFTDVTNKEHLDRAEEAMDEIYTAAINLGGVISGEHGIGLEKQKFFKRAVEPTVIDMMKNIKKLVDPNNIMNPGKIWE